MKFLKSLKIVHTDKLFQGKFKYKVVISSGLAGWFRGGNLEKINLLLEHGDYYSRKASNAEKLFAKKLCSLLTTMENWQIRVETPYISFYVDDIKSVESLVKNNVSRVKYVSIPDPNTENKLTNQTILVKKLEFDYRVTVGATNQNYVSFVNWCRDNPKVRLPKRAAKDLSKDYSPGGGYFYVKDDKSLTMVKMFLGRTITKVENVVRA
jgi:hypothetical protein